VSVASDIMSEGSALSDEAINMTVDILRTALAKSAKRDSEKWSRWYCSKRLNFEDAMNDMQSLLLKRRYNYYNILNDINEQQDGQYYDKYSCPDQFTGKGDVGMVSLLIALFGVNVLAAFFNVETVWPKVLLPDFDHSDHSGVSSVTIPIEPYKNQCYRRLMSYDYWLNVLVSAALLGGYIAYALFDVTDDSEILGKEYMADTKYIWIYFAVLINATFLVQQNEFRLLMWILLVLSSNIYSIIDLMEFAGAESEEATVNSRGVSISLDNADNPMIVFLFMIWRVGFQVIMMLYSFRIPAIARELTMKIDEFDLLNNTQKSVQPLAGSEPAATTTEIELATRDCEAALTISTDHMDTIPLDNDANDIHSSADTSTPPAAAPKKKHLTGQALTDYKHRMKLFMRLNMGVFIGICVGYVIYMAVDGTLKRTIGQIAFSAIISVAIMINMRAFFSCTKWFWLHAYGFTTPTLDLMFSNREDESKWSLETLKSMEITSRSSYFSFLLPGVQMSTEKKIRTVDAWTKKISHTYDGLLVFIISAESFAEGENTSETYSLAYGISLIYMLLYVLSYSDNGSLAWIIYGAKARIMDGFLGRENEIFGYMFDKYMLPASVPLLLWLQDAAGDTRVVYLSWYIFMPIILGDSFAEIIGSTWGKQKIKVWGMGEVNTKSWEGTLAMFFSSLVILIGVNAFIGLSWYWHIFAVVNCAVATAVELYAYRSTDNVCMMVFSSLLAIAFVNIVDA